MAEPSENNPRPLAEISHGPSAFESFLDRNQKGMIVLGLGIVAAVGAWIVVRGINESAELSAGAVVVRAEQVSELEALVAEHPGTPAAGSAHLLIADMHWENGEPDASIKTLREFIASRDDHPALPSARASLASRLMQQGETEPAAAIFRELADSPDARFIAPYALILLGDIAKADGRIEEAEQAYRRALDDFGTNPFSNLANQHLNLLGFSNPTEIEAPSPAETSGEADSTDTEPAEGMEEAVAPDAPAGDTPPADEPAEDVPQELAPEEAPEPPADDTISPEPVEDPSEGESN